MWDRENLFSVKQAISGAAVSTDVFASSEKDIATGEPLILEIMTTRCPGATDLKVAIMTGDNENRSGGVKLQEVTIPAARLEKGGPVVSVPLSTGCKSFLWLAYDGNLAGGKVTAGLALPGRPTGEPHLRTHRERNHNGKSEESISRRGRRRFRR